MNQRIKTVIGVDVDIVKRKIKDKYWLFKRYKENPEAIEIIKKLFNETI